MTDTDSTQSTTEQSKQAAGDVATHAQQKATDVGRTARDEARSVAVDAKAQAADVLGTARGELRSQAADQAKTLSGTLDDFGRQLGAMADGDGEPDTQVAQLARSAADTLSKRAARIDEGGIDGVVDDVKRFARNRPGAFLLGSIAAGFAIGRLAKHADLNQAGEAAKEEIDTDKIKPELGSGEESSDTDMNSDTAMTSGTATSTDTFESPDANVDAAVGTGRPIAGGVTP